jgi:hypothetical protein
MLGMLAISRGRVCGMLLLGALVAGPAGASTLGLEGGDIIEFIEFDALFSNGDGASYTFDGADGILTGDGRATSITVDRGGSPETLTDIGTAGAVLSFGLDLVNVPIANFVNPPTNTLLNTVIAFGGAAGTHPDFQITIGNLVVVEGNFVTPLLVGGFINTLASGGTMVASGEIVVTGGVSAFVDAVGGIGGTGILELDSGAFNFAPGLGTLAGDGNVVNSNFIVALSGTLTPTNPAAFVPEPGAMVLLGSSLVGLLAVARRRRG